MEITTRGRPRQRIEVEPDLRQRPAGTRLRHPCGERKTGRLRLIELELLDRPRAAYHLPGVRRALRCVNQDRTGRALASRLLELVSPAAVVREDFAEENGGVHETRIVDQHQQDFAPQVRALEFVPLPFGGANAVANEHHLASRRELRAHGLPGDRSPRTAGERPWRPYRPEASQVAAPRRSSQRVPASRQYSSICSSLGLYSARDCR